MEDENQAIVKIKALKDGQCHCFNMFQDGGARCVNCKGMYVLFEIPLYGGFEAYIGTYFDSQIKEMVKEAFSWT
jgi:hypothetical protein